MANNFSLQFKNEHIIWEKQIKCVVKESEYNLSYNPSLLQNPGNPSGSLVGFVTGSSFEPYATTIGLYNDNHELLAVAKFAQPIVISKNTDMTFIIRFDQ